MRHDAEGFWLAGIDEVPPCDVLESETSADVLIVGGGYTGMWTAWWIKQHEPGVDVVLLESRLCGHGPSGRNGGFCNSMWFSLPTLRRNFGDSAALEVGRAAADSIRSIGRWCAEQEVDADFRAGGYLQASTAPAHDGTWGPVQEACEELGAGEALQILDADATRARCDSPLFRGSAFYPDAATVNPAILAAGLRERLLGLGVRIYERTPLERLRHDVSGGRADTPSGSVRAGTVVLAGGGRLLELRGMKRALTATSSHMVVTEPVPDLLEELGWTGGECITDSRAMIHYFRTTKDGRIAFGWGGGRIVFGAHLGGRTEVDGSMVTEVSTHLRRFFPQLEGRRIEHAWGGPIDVSPTHLPVVRSLDDATFAGYGYTGNGVGPSQLLGRTMAAMALGRTDPETRLAIVDPQQARVPPEPFRYVGGAAIRRAMLRKERLEEEGRKVGPLTRAICGVPERLGIHVGR